MRQPKVVCLIPGFRCMECSSSEKFPYWEYARPLQSCIESIKAQTYKNIEIIIADDFHGDGGGEIRNLALKSKKVFPQDIIFNVCNDAILADPQYIEQMVRIFHDTGADIVVGSAKRDTNMTDFLYVLNVEYEDRTQKQKEGFVDMGATTYLAMKYCVLKEIGGFPVDSPVVKTGNSYFDTSFLDWDLCQLCVDRGYKIWHSRNLNVYHYYQCGLIDYMKKQFWQGWYRIEFTKRFGKFTESYATPQVMGQPFFLGLIPVLFVLSFTHTLFLYLLLITMMITFLYHAPLVINTYKKDKDLRVFWLLPLTTVRCGVWILGALWSMVGGKKHVRYK